MKTEQSFRNWNIRYRQGSFRKKLPRSANRYISSFLGFAPAENPQVLALCIIHDPKGIYYGGTIAAPVVRTIFENVLPYMGINGRNQEE